VARVYVRFKNKTANTYQNIISKETDETVSQLVCALLSTCARVYVFAAIATNTNILTYVPYVFTPFELFVY